MRTVTVGVDEATVVVVWPIFCDQLLWLAFSYLCEDAQDSGV